MDLAGKSGATLAPGAHQENPWSNHTPGQGQSLEFPSAEDRYGTLFQGLARNLMSTPYDPFAHVTTRPKKTSGAYTEQMPMELTTPYAGAAASGVSFCSDIERRQLERTESDKMLDQLWSRVSSRLDSMKKEICSTVEADVARNLNRSVEQSIHNQLQPLTTQLENMTQLLSASRINNSPQRSNSDAANIQQPSNQPSATMYSQQDVRSYEAFPSQDVRRYEAYPSQDVRRRDVPSMPPSQTIGPGPQLANPQGTDYYAQGPSGFQPPPYPGMSMNSCQSNMPPFGYSNMYGYPQQGWMNPMWQMPPMQQWPINPATQPMTTNNSLHSPLVARPHNSRPPSEVSSMDTLEEESQGRVDRRRHDNGRRDRELPSYIPKMPTFDGKTPAWTSFIHMFEMRAGHLHWDAEERLEKIRLCLTGKAIDFYIKLRDQGKCRNYMDFKRHMESRFHAKEEASTLRSKFSGMKQYVDESDEDWSERVMTVGYEAFKGLTPEFIEGEIVRRYCSGFQDKEAAEHVLNSSPNTFEDAQKLMRKYKENRKAIHGFNTKKVRKVSVDRGSIEQSESPYRQRRGRSPSRTDKTVRTIAKERINRDRSISPHRNVRNYSPRRQSPGSTNNLNALQEEFLRKIVEIVDKKIERRLSRSPSPRRDRACFVCKSKDHIAPDCPEKIEGACYICQDTSHRYQKCPQFKQENGDRSTQ